MGVLVRFAGFLADQVIFYDIYGDDRRRPTADRRTQAMMFVARPF